MRAERLVLLLAWLCGCAVDLESHSTEPATVAPPRALESCDLFGDLDGLQGRVLPVILADATELTLAARPDFDGETSSSAFVGSAACGRGAMPTASRPIVDVSAHGAGKVGTPRGSFTTDAAYVYFSLGDEGGVESEGSGIARFDADAGAFVSQGLLWTSDRPAYGASALVEDDYVYVYGGLPARFLAADVYLARVPLEQVNEPAAYEYFQGGGTWATDADLAAPILEGGTMPSVVWHAPSERYLMAYATPLAREIMLRSGLAPGGPWSRPVSFGACALPFEQAFCGDVTFLPAFAAQGELALSQTIFAFDAPPESLARDYWTKLVTGHLPENLP